MKPTYSDRLERLERSLDSDRSVAMLDPETRRALGQLWAHRAQAELTASSTFAGLHRDCVSAGAPDAVERLTARAGEDERFHSRLCARLAEHYLGAELAALSPGADPLRFECCDATLARGLRLLLHCALSETISVAYLRECHREAASPLVRAAVQELLRDEIDHARIGWAHLASIRLEGALREAFCRELPALIVLVENAWREPILSASYPPGHGVLTHERTCEVASHAIETLVLPGLASFGIVARDSR